MIIFPEEAEFQKVEQAGKDARVFLLRFKSSNQKMFFWLQEPEAANGKTTESDAKLAESINLYLNDFKAAMRDSRSAAAGNLRFSGGDKDGLGRRAFLGRYAILSEMLMAFWRIVL